MWGLTPKKTPRRSRSGADILDGDIAARLAKIHYGGSSDEWGDKSGEVASRAQPIDESAN